MEDGKIESYPLPATFIEVVPAQEHTQLGAGYTESDVTFRIHIVQSEYDAGDGTMEENKTIFGLRDTVVALLTYYEPPGCSGLMKVAESQDYEHTNVYHYILDFKASFIDTTGAIVPIETTISVLEVNPTIKTVATF